MLIVDYKEKMGEITLIQQDKEEKHTYKIGIYSANCICAFVYIYKNKGEYMYQLMNFINDEQHIKNLIKNKHKLFLGDITKISLNMWYKQNKILLDYFLKIGYKVETYYQPI